MKLERLLHFIDSGVSAIVADLALNSTNVTKNFKFQSGQRSTIYDFSRIVRKEESAVPTRRLRAYYLSAEYDASDTGDITLVDSYNSFNYGNEITSFQRERTTDMVDARPRVSKDSGGVGGRSPLEFFGRKL